MSCNQLHRVSWCLLLFGAATHAAAVTLERGPYLQSTTTHSVIVVWEQDVATSATLEYGINQSYGQSVSSPSATKHAVEIDGLQADTRYDYRILAGASELASGDGFHFDTSTNDGNVSFLVFGDSGTGNAWQMALAGRLVTESVDLILHTGDVVYSRGQQYNYNSRFFAPYADILRHTPIFPTLGNHDLDTDNGQPYLDNFHLPPGYQGGERLYSFDWGSAHFVSVETDTLDPDRIAWVDNDLAATDKPWKFVVGHNTAYSCDGRPSAAVYDLLLPVIEAHDVAVYFGGHDHNYQRSYPLRQNMAVQQANDPDFVDPPGTLHVVTGGGGDIDSADDSCWYTSVALPAIHYMRVHLSASVLTLEAVDSTGTVFDHATITRTDPPVDAVAEIPSPVLSVSPNPVRSAAVIHLGARLAVDVETVAIYSPTGRLVRRLVVSGPRLIWDGLDRNGRRAASGVYFARTESLHGSSSRGARFVLQR